MRSFNSMVLSVKLWQSVRWATNREEGGCLLPRDVYTKTGRTVVDVQWDKHPDIHVPTVGNSMCAAFEECEEVLETVPLELL